METPNPNNTSPKSKLPADNFTSYVPGDWQVVVKKRSYLELHLSWDDWSRVSITLCVLIYIAPSQIKPVGGSPDLKI